MADIVVASSPNPAVNTERLFVGCLWFMGFRRFVDSDFPRASISALGYSNVIQEIMHMKDKYIYSGKVSEVENAAGVTGVLIKLINGGYAFRVYHENKKFTDYEINHDDLPIKIESDALASFYSNGEKHSLDHSPEVFGLAKVED